MRNAGRKLRHPNFINIDEATIEIKKVTDFNLMARRALKDELPGIITRSIVRATSKAIAQKIANDNDSSGISGLAIMIGGFVMEGADERIWKTLPSQLSVGRTTLNKGKHLIKVESESFGVIEKEVEITNRYTVLQIRKFGQIISIAQANSPQEIDEVSQKEFEQVILDETKKLQPAAKEKRSESSSRKRKKPSVQQKKSI